MGPAPRLEAWMRIGQPLEPVMQDYARIFDAWQQGGVRGLVVGRLLFSDEAGKYTVPAVPPRPEAYRARGMQAEGGTGPDPVRERLLHAMLADARARDWPVLVFCPGQGTSTARPLPPAQDPYAAQHWAAVWEEVFAALPEADGGIVDGWTEAPYELTYHHGNGVFRPLTDSQRQSAEVRGWDSARLELGMQHLESSFRKLQPGRVRYLGGAGLLAGLELFDVNEDALYWLRWRREDGLREGRAVRQALAGLPRRLLLGNGLRSAVFSGMTAVDFSAWAELLDLVLVKHYFWHRGFDGLYGTVSRWVRQIHAWNPGLSEADCFLVARTWLGVELPQVNCLDDLDRGFPPEFFTQVVAGETRRALAAAGDAGKVVPWVDTGRMPHGGDPMTAADLERILQASAEAGLRRFLFHNQEHLTAGEWRVITRLCGTAWPEDSRGYWPPATPRPETF